MSLSRPIVGLFSFFFVFWLPNPAHSQWVIYNFSPQTAYLNSYGLTTNTLSSTATSRTNGWPTNWSDARAVGVMALYFSTNTSSPNFIAALDPLIFTYTSATNTNRLSTNNYVTSLGSLIGITNTNSGSLSNLCVFNRTRLGIANYLTAQYSLISPDTNANTVGTFLAATAPYTSNQLGTNGVPSGTNFLPPAINLKISSLSSLTNPATSTNRQLSLPLTINLTLTRTVNTNTSFTSALTNFGVLRSNLPLLIRSNNTYTNSPN